MKTTINQRIAHVIKDSGKTLNAFAKAIGIAQTSLRDCVKEGAEPKHSTLIKIIQGNPSLSPEWLLTGEGDMLKSTATPTYEQKRDTIKYFPNIIGSMGGMGFLDDPKEHSIELVLPGFNGCKYAINAYGDSMHPVIKSGQIVLLQEWKERFIDWGKIYLVVTKNGYRAIKYVVPSENDNTILCKSENENNPPFEVEKEEIYKMFLVKGWICREAI
mgnify:CR=1 FL=1